MSDEMHDFEQWMMAPPIAARLIEAMRPYVGRLTRLDRDWFVERALLHAWHRRSKLDPTRESTLHWWENCLRDTAASRRVWAVWNGTNRTLISGKALGRY
jgi:hypothetical protein